MFALDSVVRHACKLSALTYLYILRLSASPNTDCRTHVRALRLSLHARPVGPGQAWPHALVSRIDAMFVCTLVRVFRFGVGVCVCVCSCVRMGTRVHTLTLPLGCIYIYILMLLQTASQLDRNGGNLVLGSLLTNELVCSRRSSFKQQH